MSTTVRVLVLAGLLLAATPPASARKPADTRPAERGRTAPPVTLVCERNQLTSYNGQVTRYQRDKLSTSITIHTDWGTDEPLTITHPAPDKAQHYFLLKGRVFTADDWHRIETDSGVLITGMRAIAWVCDDGKTQPVVDWRPD